MEEIKKTDYIKESVEENAPIEEVKEEIKEEIKEEVKEEVKKESKPKYQELKCKVIVSTSDFSILDFSGYGISVPKTDKEFVTVKYTGSIGNANFKIIE